MVSPQRLGRNYDSPVSHAPALTVMGEVLVDIIIDADGELTSVIGGGELNTARAIARLGVPVQFLGGISTDPLGQRIRRSMEADGMSLALPEGVDAPTTLAIAQIADDGSATYRFLLEGTSMASVEAQQALTAVSPDSPFLHVGSIALAVEPFASAAVAVVQQSPPSRLVMVDPNFRPSISGTSPVFRRTLDAMLSRTDVFKASTEDLASLFPEQEPLESATALHDEFGFVVLVTDGASDVWVVTKDGTERCSVPFVDVVDSVGAGDSFSGGFAAWWTLRGLGRDDLHRTSDVLQAVRAGIAVAAANCRRAGANPPRREELPADWIVLD